MIPVTVPPPANAYQVAYDAQRRCAATLLATYGLRATSSGGHLDV
jgi:hypothetical protein